MTLGDIRKNLLLAVKILLSTLKWEKYADAVKNRLKKIDEDLDGNLQVFDISQLF